MELQEIKEKILQQLKDRKPAPVIKKFKFVRRKKLFLKGKPFYVRVNT